jgi:hypothetical protein
VALNIIHAADLSAWRLKREKNEGVRALEGSLGAGQVANSQSKWFQWARRVPTDTRRAEGDVPNAPPIAPGGGNAWHMGCHVAYMAIMAALVYRTVAGEGQYIDASIHDQHTWEHDR